MGATAPDRNARLRAFRYNPRMSPRLRLLALPPILGLLGCNDAGFTRHNAEPAAQILSPAEGEAVREATALTLRGAVSDPDHAARELLARWYIDDVIVCDERVPNSDGSVACAMLVPDSAFRVDLEVFDPVGAAALVSLEVEVIDDLPPTATITSPVGEGPWYSDRPVPMDALVSDAEDDPTTLAVRWVSSLDPDLAATATIDADGAVHGYATLTEGTHALEFFVEDSAGQVATDDVLLTVGPPNRAPTCALALAPDGGVSVPGATVLLEGSVLDADLPAPRLVAGWESSADGPLGTSTPDADGKVSLSLSTLSIGVHTLSLWAEDELGERCTAEMPWTVNTPPTLVIAAPLDGDVVNDGEELLFLANVEDVEDDPDALFVTWTSDLDGLLAEGTADAGGRSVFSLDELSVGQHLVTVTVTDTVGTSATELVEFRVNGLPDAPVVSLSPTTPLTLDDLVASLTAVAIDPDGDPLTYRYDWLVDGAASAASSTDTLPASATVRDQTWTVEVRAEDAWGSGPAGTASVRIGNSVPALLTVDLSPDPATRSATLTCTPSGYSDDDGDADQSTLQWTVDGTVVGAGSSLSGVFTTGNLVTCAATPFDGTDTGLVVYDSVLISNSPPEVTTLSLSPSNPYTNDTLTASVAASDAEGDTITLAYAWTVNGTLVSTGTSLPGSDFVKHDVVELTVTASDADGPGTPASASVTILNTPPTAPIVRFDPTEPIEGDALLCEVDAPSTDADGDAIDYTMSWTVDGAAYPAGGDVGPSTVSWTDDEASASDTHAPELFACTVTPNDGDDDGPSASASVLIDDGITRVFVSSTGLSTGFGALANADAHCQTVADAAAIGGTWVAWVSSSGASASGRIPEGPYLRLDGVTVASSRADLLDGSLSATISVNELGAAQSGYVLTGSTISGGPAYSGGTGNGLCSDWSMSCGVCYGNHWYMTAGNSSETGKNWTDLGWLFCGGSYPVYCFEQ